MKRAMIIILFAVGALGCSLPNCFDPTFASPVPRPPQFVLVTHDDAVTHKTQSLLDEVHRCGVPMTFFVLQENTVPEYVRTLYDNGDEIALHTVHHPHLPKMHGSKLYHEIFDVRDWLVAETGIPREKMIGFRAPYLDTNTEVRKTLFDGTDIQWESTYNVDPKSPWFHNNSKVWPFTMDSGTVLKSKIIDHESYPGRWEVPLIAVTDGTNDYSMDPGVALRGAALKPGDTMKMLHNTLDESRNGNRAPMGIYFHTPWLATPGYVNVLNDFIDYAIKYDDVRFVTTSQLIDWMKNPKNVEEMPAVDYFKCYNVTM
jgi:peptidoglycan/xylan/chitin deacetylase (PgdA/CDA1 family)